MRTTTPFRIIVDLSRVGILFCLKEKKKLPLGDTELDLTGTDEQTEVALQAGCLQPMGLLATDPKKIIRPARLRTLDFLWLDELVDEYFSRSTVSLIERRRIMIENLKVRRPCGCSRTSRPATTARSSRSLISFPRASDHLSFRLRLTSFRVFLGYSPLAFSVIFPSLDESPQMASRTLLIVAQHHIAERNV